MQLVAHPDPWQPIETAPKYKNVLVWREDAGEPWIARFDSNCEYLSEDECDPDHEAWISGEYGFHEGDEAPTHWMPLPDGPASDD